MQGMIGLLLYIAVMILGSILKKMAEDKAKQARRFQAEADPVHTTAFNGSGLDESSLEGSLAEEVDFSDAKAGFGTLTYENVAEFQAEGTKEESWDDWDNWDESDESGEADATNKGSKDSESRLDQAMLPRASQWAQAIVLSEIIREPRARRAWPNR